MGRLDYSFLGRPLQKYGMHSLNLTINKLVLRLIDLLKLEFINLSTFSYNISDAGYAAYKSYLHMELNYTHPIGLGESVRKKSNRIIFILFWLAFFSACLNAIRKQSRTYDGEEYCRTMDDHNRCEESRENRFQQNRTNSSKRNNTNDESIQNSNHNIYKSQLRRTPKTSSHQRENDSTSVIIHENNPIRVEYKKPNDEGVTSIPKTMPIRELPNSSIVRIK